MIHGTPKWKCNEALMGSNFPRRCMFFMFFNMSWRVSQTYQTVKLAEEQNRIQHHSTVLFKGPCFHFHVKPACAFTSLAIAAEGNLQVMFRSKSPMFSCTCQIYQSSPWPSGFPTSYMHLGHDISSPWDLLVCWFLGSIGPVILWKYMKVSHLSILIL